MQTTKKLKFLAFQLKQGTRTNIRHHHLSQPILDIIKIPCKERTAIQIRQLMKRIVKFDYFK